MSNAKDAMIEWAVKHAEYKAWLDDLNRDDEARLNSQHSQLSTHNQEVPHGSVQHKGQVSEMAGPQRS